MIKIFGLVIMVASLLAFSSAGHAATPQASQAFADGTRAFEAGDYLRALSRFQAARDAGMQGPAVHYNIAVCQYELGEYRQAEATFRAIARDYPAMRELAQYNAGLALQRQGREPEAQLLFQSVQQGSGDDKLARLAAAKLTQGSRSSAEPPSWLTLFDFNVGHDDNVALLDDSVSPSGQSLDSPFTEFSAFVTGPFDKSTGFRLDASAYLVRYGDVGEFDQDLVRLGGAYRWRPGAWRMEAGPHWLQSFLDGESLERRLGVGLSLRREITSGTTFGIRVLHDEIDAGSSQFWYLEGAREHLGLTFERSGVAGALTLGLDLESNDRESAGVSPTRQRVWMRHRHRLGAAWTTDLLLAHRASAYDTRDEDLLEVSAGMIRTLAGQWEITARYAWSENDSNVEAFSYGRRRLSMGLTKGF